MMGRAERRRLDRQNRIEERKSKVLVSPKDIRQMKRDIIDDVNNYKTEALMTCFALAEHRLYGFGSKRIIRTLQCIDDFMGDILDGKVTIEDYKKELEEKAGVVVKCD